MSGSPCHRCEGSGRIRETMFSNDECHICGGSGYEPEPGFLRCKTGLSAYQAELIHKSLPTAIELWTPVVTTKDVPPNREFVLGNSSLWRDPMICYFGGGEWYRDDGHELGSPPQEWISFDRILAATGKKE